MLTHPTINQLLELKLDGMADAFAELQTQDRAKDLGHAEWLALLLDREAANRNTKRAHSRLKAARLRHGQASIEDVDYRTPRQLDKALFQQLATCRWIAEHRNLLVTGPCGIGKSWLACALAQKACRDGYTVHYARVPRLFADLELAHGDGRFPRLFRTLTKADLLILDDWGPDRLNSNQRRDLMEIVEDRYGAGSTLITSQLPTDTWHEVIGEPTFADAILDRVVHNAYRLAPQDPRRGGGRCIRRGDHRHAGKGNEGSQEMSPALRIPPAPVGQQGPPTRAAASDSWRSLRVARGSLPLTTGTAYRRQEDQHHA
jgi:DNA replication protein DnaC